MWAAGLSENQCQFFPLVTTQAKTKNDAEFFFCTNTIQKTCKLMYQVSQDRKEHCGRKQPKVSSQALCGTREVNLKRS